MQMQPKTRFYFFQLDTISSQVLLVCQLGLLVSLLLTMPLWLAGMPIFPQVPLFAEMPHIPENIQISLFSIALICLLVSFFSKIRTWALVGFILTICASITVDFQRIQPWLYYFTVFISLILLAGKDENKSNTLIAFALSCIYIYSGLQKFNAGFATDTYPWLIAPITKYLPENITHLLSKTWLVAPLTELGAGLGLWFLKTRNFSRWTLVGMHLFILGMIGPLGHNSNSVIWPWNIAFVVFLIILFKPNTEFSIHQVFRLRSRVLKPIVCMLFAVLPFFSFFDAWPKHLSAALYSGNKVKSDLYLTDEIATLLPTYVNNRVAEHDNKISATTWAMKELNVAIYPSQKVHLAVFKQLCINHPDESELLVVTIF